jgi:hypothetical protein
MGDPIPTKGQTLWYSMYNIIPLRLANTAFVNFFMCLFGDIRNPVHEKVTEFREIPRNFTELYVTEFGGIPTELQPLPHGIRNRRK